MLFTIWNRFLFLFRSLACIGFGIIFTGSGLKEKKKEKKKKKKSGSKFASNLDNSFSVSVIIIAYMIRRREGKLKKKGKRTPLKIVGLFYAIVQ